MSEFINCDIFVNWHFPHWSPTHNLKLIIHFMFNISPASNMTDNRTSAMYHINKLVEHLLIPIYNFFWRYIYKSWLEENYVLCALELWY